MDSFENFSKEESDNLKKSALEFLTNLLSEVPILGTVVSVRKTWIDFVNYRKSVKLEEFVKNFTPEDKSELLELCNKKDEDLFKILEFFDKVVQSESKWVIRCLTEITSMFIRNLKLDDDYRFYYETIYKANDSDMEFFCNAKKMWENKRTKFELELRDLENTGNENEINNVNARINHKCVTPNSPEDLTFLNINSFEHAYAKINRLNSLGMLSGSLGGYLSPGQAHGYAIWNDLSEKLHEFIIKFRSE